MNSLTIGALAKEAGVGVETVRFYERRGLIRRPSRPGTGYRSYPVEAIGRIRFIRNAQGLGFTLQEVKELLALRVTAGMSCAAVRARAAAKVADVKRRLTDLDRMKAALDSLIAVCPGRGALVNCTILDALDSAEVDVPHRRRATKRRAKGVLAMKSLEMKIGGMQCDGCASTIQSILSREPGVKSSSVSFPNRAASVFYDPKETDTGRLAEAVTKAGFSVEGRQ
jgi:Hg(II)-responsive transcriptional regulator